MKEIALTQGYVAIVDDEDYEKLSEHKWHAAVRPTSDGRRTAYAMRRVTSNGERKLVFMHHEILGACGVVDHINGNPCDNTRSNLRLATHSQNNANSTPRANCSSQYKGVCLHRHSGRYVAYINHNKKRIHLGCYGNEVDAARAYNEAAVILFGAFCRKNEV